MGDIFKALFGLFLLPIVLPFVAMGELMALGVPDKVAEVSTFENPTASEGRTIPILFGTRMLKGPNTCGFKSNGAVGIYQKVKITPW